MKIFVVTGTTDDGQVIDKLNAFVYREAAEQFITDEKNPENIYQYDEYEIDEVELVGVKGWV